MRTTSCAPLLLLLLAAGCSSDTHATAQDARPESAPADQGLDQTPDAQDAGTARPDFLAPDGPLVLPELGQLTMYVNLGDSIAAAWNAAVGYRDLLHDNDDQAYPAYQGKDLLTRYPGIQLVDRAYGGATSADTVDQARFAPANPAGNTLVVISVGGNDLLNDVVSLTSADKTREVAQTVTDNLGQIVDTFADQARYPGEVFFAVLNVFDMTDGTGLLPDGEPLIDLCDRVRAFGPLVGKALVQNLALFNQIVEDFVQARGLMLIDIHDGFLCHGFNYKDPALACHDPADATLWFQYDCLHPTVRGHHEIRRMIWHRLFGEFLP